MITIWDNIPEVIKVITQEKTKTAILIKLGLSPKCVRNFRNLTKFIENYDVNIKHLQIKGRLKSEYWSSLEQHVKDSNSLTEVIDRLGLKQYGSNHQRVKQEILKNNLDISHFSRINRRITLRSVSSRGSNRKRVIREQKIEYKCEKCGNIGIWLNQPLTLQLDHIDGDATNHSDDNLRFLCPNCHTQTSTWGSK